MKEKSTFESTEIIASRSLIGKYPNKVKLSTMGALKAAIGLSFQRGKSLPKLRTIKRAPGQNCTFSKAGDKNVCRNITKRSFFLKTEREPSQFRSTSNSIGFEITKMAAELDKKFPEINEIKSDELTEYTIQQSAVIRNILEILTKANSDASITYCSVFGKICRELKKLFYWPLSHVHKSILPLVANLDPQAISCCLIIKYYEQLAIQSLETEKRFQKEKEEFIQSSQSRLDAYLNSLKAELEEKSLQARKVDATELNEAKEKIYQLEKENKQFISELEKEWEKVERLREEIWVIRDHLQERGQKKKKLKTSLQEIEKMCNSLQTKNNRIEMELDSYKKQCAQLSEDNISLSEKLSTVLQKMSMFSTQIEALEEKNEFLARRAAVNFEELTPRHPDTQSIAREIEFKSTKKTVPTVELVENLRRALYKTQEVQII